MRGEFNRQGDLGGLAGGPPESNGRELLSGARGCMEQRAAATPMPRPSLASARECFWVCRRLPDHAGREVKRGSERGAARWRRTGVQGAAALPRPLRCCPASAAPSSRSGGDHRASEGRCRGPRGPGSCPPHSCGHALQERPQQHAGPWRGGAAGEGAPRSPDYGQALKWDKSAGFLQAARLAGAGRGNCRAYRHACGARSIPLRRETTELAPRSFPAAQGPSSSSQHPSPPTPCARAAPSSF